MPIACCDMSSNANRMMEHFGARMFSSSTPAVPLLPLRPPQTTSMCLRYTMAEAPSRSGTDVISAQSNGYGVKIFMADADEFLSLKRSW